MADFTAQAFGLALDRMSDEAKAQFLQIASQGAQTLAGDLERAYPLGPTGHLRGGVLASRATRAFGYLVRARAPHVNLIELGTRDRRDNTRRNAFRGRMRATPIFVPTAIRVRSVFGARVQAWLDERREL